MINCDSNSTVYSIQDDIFTLARDRGAAAAMLYSLTSHSCNVNPEYLQNFEKPLDVFSAASLQGARLIESQFSNVLGAGYWFESGLLNSSASTILDEIKSLGLSNLTDSFALNSAQPTAPPSQAGPNNQPNSLSDSSTEPPLERRSYSPNESSSRSSQKLIARSSYPTDHSSHLKLNMNPPRHPSGVNMNAPPVYLIATLANPTITGNLDSQKQDRNHNSTIQNTSFNNNNPSTGLAMIILYAITGCVSFMFLIVIVSGAIRAIRNPDRYGPRPGGRVDPQTGEEDPYAQPRQTRAAGLGKAILDTFPIVKFGRHRNDPKLDSEGTSHVLEDPKAIDPTSPGEESIMMREPALVQPSPGLVLSNSNRSVKDGGGEIEEEPSPNASHASPWQITASQLPLMSINLSADGREGNEKPDSNHNSTRNATLTLHDDLTLHKIPEPTEHASKSNSHAEIGGELVDVNNSITCPICVCDFEEDDDIRMLPCDARHQFHKDCVDPWLLNESKFCPLCRWDLSTRKDGTKIITQVAVEAESDGPSTPGSGQPMPVSAQPDDEPSNVQNSQSASTSRAARRTSSSRLSRTLGPWLSLGYETSPSDGESSRPPASPPHGRQNRTSYFSSIVPHMHKRRHESPQEESATLEQPQAPNADSPMTSQAVQDGRRHTSDNNPYSANEHADESGSKSRFHKYLAHIRRKKQSTSPS